MEQYFINKHDWTEVVVRKEGTYRDGQKLHAHLKTCHEADVLDYGEPNPFADASRHDVLLVHRYAQLLSDYLVSMSAIDEAAEELVTYWRYQLIRNRVRVEVAVQAREECAEAYKLLRGLQLLTSFIQTCTAMDEPELCWALKRSRKLLAVLDSPSARSESRLSVSSNTQYYLNRTTPLLLAARIGGVWLEQGDQVDHIHEASYEPVSMLAARWIYQLGNEFRICWVEAKRYFQALAAIAEHGDGLDVAFSDRGLRKRYHDLVVACISNSEELDDYITFITQLRKAAVHNGMTHRSVIRLSGEASLDYHASNYLAS